MLEPCISRDLGAEAALTGLFPDPVPEPFALVLPLVAAGLAVPIIRRRAAQR
jgi:hypothetical protein